MFKFVNLYYNLWVRSIIFSMSNKFRAIYTFFSYVDIYEVAILDQTDILGCPFKRFYFWHTGEIFIDKIYLVWLLLTNLLCDVFLLLICHI